MADPSRAGDVTVDLVARQGRVKLASGREIDGYTLNGTTPGPHIKATEGRDRRGARSRNESVEDGVALHWHGIDVPNAEDGVAGVTQDAVGVGESHTYRFVAEQVGTYWYHSHQVSHKQVIGGLFGSLVVMPKDGIEQDQDVVAIAHTYRGTRTLNGRGGRIRVRAEPGDTVRVRIVNTDNGTMPVWASDALPSAGDRRWRPERARRRSTDRRLTMPAGGRADLEVIVPESGTVRVQVAAATAYVIGPEEDPSRHGRRSRSASSTCWLRITGAALFDIDDPDRSFDYLIGRRLGFLDGKPGNWWTINGHLYPDVPMFMVREGDVVTFHINNSGEVHPMHLHGHHAVVIARDAQTGAGSPVWVDSIDVETARPSTSPSRPTTRASGWTTATTSRTPRRASWRT